MIISRLVFLLVAVVSVALTPSIAFAQEAATPEIQENGTEITVKNAEIAAIVRIFSKKTKRNYILDEKVKGKVSIYLPGKISEEESIRILDSVLALKGFSTVPIGDNLWKIVPANEAKQSTIPTRSAEEGRDGSSASMVTKLVNLKFVNADEVKQLLSQLISSSGLLNAYTGTNSLILIDFEDNIDRLMKIIENLDVASSDREMTIIPVKHAEAPDIADKLNSILTEDSKEGQPSELLRRNTPQNNARAGGTGPANAVIPTSGSSETVTSRGRAPKIIADERTNSIIVVADLDTTARIEALVAQLDSELDLSGAGFYVYRCQHANAEDLAEVLSGLMGGGESSSTRTSQKSGTSGSTSGSDDLFGGSGNRSSSFSTQNRLASQRRTPGQSRATPESAAPSTFQFGDNASITADPATNSLVINAGKTDYERILKLLKQLDIKRRQVLVEALLLEVGIDESTSLGTEFFVSGGGSDGGVIAANNMGNLGTLLSDPRQLSDFSMAAASAGSLTLPGDITIPTQAILVRAAQNNSNVNVLSSPNILTTDNEEAEIVVGQNVPFLASTATDTTNINNTFNQIDRQDVGITLRITPQISSEDFVTLKIFTEVSNVLPGTENSSLGPTTTVRTSETTVISKDQQMIVIGGLMADGVLDAERGVPFLKDIPVLGSLFRTTSENNRRTNLLIFITPRVIRDQFDARDQTIEQRGVFENEADRLQIDPDRKEFLHRKEVNNTTEAPAYEGPKPGTIRGPENSTDPTAEKTRGVLELRVGPDQSADRSTEPQYPTNQATGEIAKLLPDQSSSRTAANQLAGDLYLLMQADKNTSAPKGLPFPLSKEGRYFGVVIPRDGYQGARDFFQVGSRYSYLLSDSKLTFAPLGSFPSRDEAQLMHPGEMVTWYTLSPHEIMRLGKSPWIKR